MHDDDDVAPTTVLIEPRGHGVHAVWLALEYVPVGHGEHCAWKGGMLETAPEELPGGHGAHVADPVDADQPAGHAAHDAW